MNVISLRPLLALSVSLILALPATAADWPHWLGPNGNGSSPETGLLTALPAKGPKILWKVPGGEGYSAVAVVGGRAITLAQRDGGEFVLALDAANGKELWTTKIAGVFKNMFGNGPRSTPAIEGKFVYATSVSGPVVCLEADSGKIVWQRDILKEFGAKNITWGLAASPLVEGNMVLVIPGAKGAGVAALDKRDGKTIWKSTDNKASYASPVAVTVGGQRQILFFTAPGLLAVKADDGKELWRVPWETEYDVNICTPLIIGNKLFVASGEQVGSTLFELNAQGPPKVVWESKGKKGVMTTYWANAVHHDGYLYGLSGEFDKVIDLNCVELATGKLMWSQKKFGKAAVTLAQGQLFTMTKTGDLVLIHCNPKGYLERGRVRLLGDNRTVPTLANRRLYLRDLQHIYCLDVAASQ
ncbi:MAG TPA: PQQ-binding-like beta-propeller repeat protein [Gemmataceae bacterium]|nr:PQQ-binding-like beta-propeller repeat protein [Gemmataceae bacterium]